MLYISLQVLVSPMLMEVRGPVMVVAVVAVGYTAHSHCAPTCRMAVSMMRAHGEVEVVLAVAQAQEAEAAASST